MRAGKEAGMKTPTFKAIRCALIALACALLMLPGRAFAAGEKITVAVVGPDAEGAPAYYAPETEVELADGDDAWTASSTVFGSAGLAFEAEDSAYGVYLDSITSPVDGTALAYDDATGCYWQLFVDGVASEVGISDVEVADGTQIVWFYSAFGDEIPESIGVLADPDAAATADEPVQGAGGIRTGVVVAAAAVVVVVVCGVIYMRKRNAA